MSNNTVVALYYLVCLAIYVGTGYVVFYLGHSGWWYVLAVLITMALAPSEKEKK